MYLISKVESRCLQTNQKLSNLHLKPEQKPSASELHANVNQSMRMKYTQVHIFGRIHVRLNCSLIAAMYEKGRFMVSYRPIEGVFGFLHALALINTHRRSYLSLPTGSGSRPPCLCAPKSWRIRRGACRCVYGKPCTPGEDGTGWWWKNWWDNSARCLKKNPPQILGHVCKCVLVFLDV